jgi:hypothetical protein
MVKHAGGKHGMRRADNMHARTCAMKSKRLAVKAYATGYWRLYRSVRRG